MLRFNLVLAVSLAVSLVVFLAATAAPAVEFEFDVREKLVYSTIGDRELLLDAYVPAGDGSYPAVLVVHGGAWRVGNRHQLANYATTLAEMGFVCFAIDYRLAPQHKFPAQIDDCRAAVHWIRTHAKDFKVNSQKLGAIGYSAGGHLASLLATTGEAPNAENGDVDTRVQAVVAGGAPTDFRWFPDNGAWAEYLMGGDLDSVPDKFQQASSAAFVDKDDAPIFFFNGTRDKVVPLAWSLSCYNELQKAGVPTEMHRIEGASHMQAATDPEALRKAWAFLREELQNDDADR